MDGVQIMAHRPLNPLHRVRATEQHRAFATSRQARETEPYIFLRTTLSPYLAEVAPAQFN
jgi:hypothetical protein